MINDEEIDLTEHQDFKQKNFVGRNFPEAVINSLRKSLYGENSFPWEVIPQKRRYKYDGLVALGNSEERKEAIDMAFWGTMDNLNCDCCGKRYIKIPWQKNFGLCKECSLIYSKTDKEDFFDE